MADDPLTPRPKAGGAAQNPQPPAPPRPKAAPETAVPLPRHVHPANRKPGEA
jgi:hypothetical protein